MRFGIRKHIRTITLIALGVGAAVGGLWAGC